MNKLILTLVLLFSTNTLLCMNSTQEGATNGSMQMIDRATHNQKVAELQAQIAEKETAIGAEKLHHAKAVQSLHRRWDLKNAITPAVYTVLIGGKTAYDIYTFLNTPEVPQWLDITNLTLDGAMLLYTGGKTSWHLLRACYRKAKVE